MGDEYTLFYIIIIIILSLFILIIIFGPIIEELYEKGRKELFVDNRPTIDNFSNVSEPAYEYPENEPLETRQLIYFLDTSKPDYEEVEKILKELHVMNIDIIKELGKKNNKTKIEEEI